MPNALTATVEARRFVDDLGQNRDMDSGWQAAIGRIASEEKSARDGGASAEQIRASLSDDFEALDNFIADRGYDTTAIAVLSFLKSPLYQDWCGDSTPNAAARDFVQRLLTDASVARSWQGLVADVGAGRKTGADLDLYLKQNGFACSYVQINGAFKAMRDHNVTYWSGAYLTQVSVDGGAEEDGPVLTLSNRDAASMGLLQVDRAVIDQGAGLMFENGVLSWRSSPSVAFSGSVTFSTITQPGPSNGDYVGNLFSGSMTYARDDLASGRTKGPVVQITGRLGTVSDQDPRTPPGAAGKFNGFPKWVTYIVTGLLVVQMLASLGRKYAGFQDFEKDAQDGDYTDRVDRSTDGLARADEDAADTLSPFADGAALDGSSLAQYLQERERGAVGAERQDLAAERTEAAAREQDFDAQAPRDADPAGDGWGGRLADAGDLIP